MDSGDGTVKIGGILEEWALVGHLADEGSKVQVAGPYFVPYNCTTHSFSSARSLILSCSHYLNVHSPSSTWLLFFSLILITI